MMHLPTLCWHLFANNKDDWLSNKHSNTWGKEDIKNSADFECVHWELYNQVILYIMSPECGGANHGIHLPLKTALCKFTN